jgi:hypothetical protein
VLVVQTSLHNGTSDAPAPSSAPIAAEGGVPGVENGLHSESASGDTSSCASKASRVEEAEAERRRRGCTQEAQSTDGTVATQVLDLDAIQVCVALYVLLVRPLSHECMRAESWRACTHSPIHCRADISFGVQNRERVSSASSADEGVPRSVADAAPLDLDGDIWCTAQTPGAAGTAS